jgi:signal transduction histidine kinase
MMAPARSASFTIQSRSKKFKAALALLRLLNLILNAVEAMGSVQEGPRELSVCTEQSHANGVLVVVRDSGPGIDAEHFERVFETFYTTKSSGVGMGLSICRSIIDAHGGRLWTDANDPRGAVFQFTLPSLGNELTNSAILLRDAAKKKALQTDMFG